MRRTLVEHVKGLWKQWPIAGLSTRLTALQGLREILAGVRQDAPANTSEAERRPLSVLFCDLVGSTPQSRRLDPEDMRDVLTAYHGVVREVIRAHEGYTAQLLGDGVLAYFGWPNAHEDDPLRAIRAGLEVVRACNDLAARLRSQYKYDLRVRVGIHTGTAVVGEMGERGRSEYLAVGDVPNVAAKTQAAAPAQTVLVTEATRRLAGGAFEFNQVAAATNELPFELYRVVSESQLRTRLDWTDSLTSFVGRAAETRQLEAAWSAAGRGKKLAVIVSGEPGSGKSRLVREFRRRLNIGDVLYCTCAVRHQNSPFHPLADLLEQQIGLNAQLSEAERGSRAAAWLKERHSTPDALPALQELLALQRTTPATATSAIKQRRVTLNTLLSLLTSKRNAPTLLVVEDVQWADPSTLELLELLLKSSAKEGLLMLLTARRDASFKLAQDSKDQVTTLEIEPLSRADASSMIAALTNGQAVQRELQEFLLARSSGIPMYLEELLQHLLDSRLLTRTQSGYQLQGSLTDISVPVSMQALLTERLDRLGHSRQLTQAASVLGMMFDDQTLARVVGRTAQQIERELDALVRSSVVLRIDAHHYAFRHALMREAAYQNLSRERRLAYHRAVAEVLATSGSTTAAVAPEMLAYHYAGAGDAYKAANHWLASGRAAIGRHALLEAMGSLRKGLECCSTLSASHERDALEVDLLSALGFTCIATQGFSAKEVEEIFTHARDLSTASGSTPPMHVLFGIWAVYLVRGDREPVAELAQKFKAITELPDAPEDERLIAHACLATYHFYAGDTAAASSSSEQGIALCDQANVREQNLRLMTRYGYDGLLFSHVFRAWNALHAGELERVPQLLEAVLEIAKEIDTPYCHALASAFVSTMARDLGKPELAQEHAARAIALSMEYGYPFWLASGLFAAGWAAIERGESAEGLAQIEQGLAVYNQIGARISKPYYLTYLVEAQLQRGDLAAAERAADEALEVSEQCVGRHCVPELLRLKAEIAFRDQRTEQARAYCEDALRRAAALGQKHTERKAERTLRAHT